MFLNQPPVCFLTTLWFMCFRRTDRSFVLLACHVKTWTSAPRNGKHKRECGPKRCGECKQRCMQTRALLSARSRSPTCCNMETTTLAGDFRADGWFVMCSHSLMSNTEKGHSWASGFGTVWMCKCASAVKRWLRKNKAKESWEEKSVAVPINWMLEELAKQQHNSCRFCGAHILITIIVCHYYVITQ